MDLELVGIEDEVVETIALVDLGGNGYGTLEAEFAAKLKVVEREAVVRGFGPGESC